jgi:hypothetical protein
MKNREGTKCADSRVVADLASEKRGEGKKQTPSKQVQ